MPVWLALLCGASFGLVTWRTRLLSASGSAAGSVLGTTLLLRQDPVWIIPALTFFLLSTALTKVLGKEPSGTERSAVQVMSNGGVGWLLLATSFVTENEVLLWAFLGSFAAAAADTWATEIGVAVRGETRSILTFRPVEVGKSGGVSTAGLVASVAGASSIWLAAALCGPAFFSWEGFVVLVGAGFVGALLDSLVGASLQATYTNGHSIAESPFPGSRRYSGLPWVSNDTVNMVCTVSGAAAAAAGYLLLLSD